MFRQAGRDIRKGIFDGIFGIRTHFPETMGNSSLQNNNGKINNIMLFSKNGGKK